MILRVYTLLNLPKIQSNPPLKANKSNAVNRIKANVDHFSHFGEKTGCHFKGSSTPASMGPLSQRQAQFPPQRRPSLPVTERCASEPVRSNEAGVEGGRVDPWRQLWGSLASCLGPFAPCFIYVYFIFACHGFCSNPIGCSWLFWWNFGVWKSSGPWDCRYIVSSWFFCCILDALVLTLQQWRELIFQTGAVTTMKTVVEAMARRADRPGSVILDAFERIKGPKLFRLL